MCLGISINLDSSWVRQNILEHWSHLHTIVLPKKRYAGESVRVPLVPMDEYARCTRATRSRTSFGIVGSRGIVIFHFFFHCDAVVKSFKG